MFGKSVVSTVVLSLCLTAYAGGATSSAQDGRSRLMVRKSDGTGVTRKAHAEFRLPPGEWKHEYEIDGSYRRSVKLSDGSTCVRIVNVRANTSSAQPANTTTGKLHRPVGKGPRWAVGRVGGARPKSLAFGYRRAPAVVASAKDRWVSFYVTLDSAPLDAACTRLRNMTALRNVISSAHVVPGA